ncbi:hypothetical protein FNV43_RR20757 [Rhamnella rubrinervis]|uniref:Uncharacterized protein n=1 Tax=Rhamnella rubrinervis TaxID=2594499 RepID=A0A8K0E0C0_9ROSA|nr:hypothetical protein FNV43_RR20757 [Rhamnella rubrinervis]
MPFLNLIDQLLTRGLRVTMAVTTNNLHLLQPLLSAYPSSLQTLPLDHHENTDPSRNWLFANARATYDLHSPVLLKFFQSHPSPPVAIISDFFLGWTNQLASQLGVPRIVFSPSPSCALSVYYSLWRELPHKDDPNDDDKDFVVSFPNVPNSPAYSVDQLPDYYIAYKEGNADSEFYRDCELGNVASWGVLLNSFTELERVYIDHLKEVHGGDRVWAVGPVHRGSQVVNSGEKSSESTLELMTWLDECSTSSVVFVSFGSWVTLTDEQVSELAEALEQSGVHFVWRVNGVHKGNNTGGECEVMPDGFRERVADRGFVTKGWVPQVEILSHPAVGSFLTHCGWSSVVEAVTEGVMMLTWPMSADQFINAKLLVEELGVAVRLREGTQTIPESGEMARILAESLDPNMPERARVKRLSEAALEAVKDGSSKRDLDELVKQLGQLKK